LLQREQITQRDEVRPATRSRQAAACTAASRINQPPEGLLIRVTGYGRFRLCRLHRIHAWQQLAHLREVTGDAVLLPGEVVDLAVGGSATTFGISVDLGEQLPGLDLGLASSVASFSAPARSCAASTLAVALISPASDPAVWTTSVACSSASRSSCPILAPRPV
jgi:hypothetical protein